MIIMRHGHERNEGIYEIELKSPKFSAHKSGVTIKDNGIKDFSKSSLSRHDYTITIYPEEINSLINAVAEAATNNPEIFKNSLNKSEKKLIRILAVINDAKFEESINTKLSKIKLINY